MSEVKTNKISSLASNNDITLDPDGTGDVVVASGHKLGIGTTSPDHTLTVSASSSPVLEIEQTSGGPYKTNIVLNGNDTEFRGSSGNIEFFTGNNDGASSTERMRIDSSGNVLVGKTSTDIGVDGSRIGSFGAIFTRASNEPLRLNRRSSDGVIVKFDKDGTTVGSVGIESAYGFHVDGESGHAGLQFITAGIIPRQNNARIDNVIDLGTGSFRYDDIFATNSTIQTSDQNEKEQIASLTTAEMTAAKAISKLFKTFKWQDKVAAKGDAARTHAGVIAQEVQTAMTGAGLDASKYAFWCSNTWWETSTDVPAVEADEEAGIEARDAYTRIDTYDTADEAPESATQRTRLGIRYPELLAFIGAATEQRLANLETRVTALEDA